MPDNFLIVAAGIVFAFLATIVCVQMTPLQRLSVASFLAVPQFFFPGIPISLADAWIVLMFATACADSRVRLRQKKFLYPVFTLAGIYVIAQLWSEEPFSPTSTLVVFRLLCFALLAVYALSVAEEGTSALLKCFRWAVPWVLLQAALVIAFKLSPALEMRFLTSRFADVLVGPSASGLFTGFANNVLDPAKAGGLFVNGNVASMFLGVTFFLLLAAIRAGGSRSYYLFALIVWAAVWATGSKTGVALALVLPVAAFLIPRLARGKSRLLLLSVALVMVPVTAALPALIETVAPQYADNSAVSLGSRGVLWEAAAFLFLRDPWLGLGFDGWSANIGAVVGYSNLPPHNMVIAAWANAGILAAGAIIAFIVVVGMSFLTRIFNEVTLRTRQALTCALLAIAWVFIHGMGDNTTFYGEFRTASFVALALGFYLAAGAGTQEEIPTPVPAKEPLRLLHAPAPSHFDPRSRT